ncbi:MAG: DUF2061 domain-containing protein [Pseudobacteriovorax sp.]|nr:DUF2061 domain-containing protein [Pseudobacteriovorax sp.]
MKSDSNLRSLSKTISWRILATTATGLLVYIFTGNLNAALAIGGSEALLKMLLYFIHERIWNQIPAGRKTVV